MTTVEDNIFANFKKYLLTHVLNSENTESPVLQRLKILAKASQNHVQFKIIGDSSTYLVYTRGEQFPNNILIQNVNINDIVPFRSAIIQASDDDVTIINYSITHVHEVSNEKFVELIALNANSNNVNVSYEGPIIVCDKISDVWSLRTTACIDAFKSHFNSTWSHGAQFARVCELKGFQKWTDMFDLLEKKYYNAYFVFILITPEQRYLCTYNDEFNNGCDLILIDVRDKATHRSIPFTEQIFAKPKNLTVEEVKRGLEENRTFGNSALKIQGYVLKSKDGNFRTYTNAYSEGMRLIPNYDSKFVNALSSYMNKKIYLYFDVSGLQKEYVDVAEKECGAVFNSVRNIIAYMFVLFTDFDVSTRSFKKRNSELYSALKTNAVEESIKHYVHTYLNILARLQGYSVNVKKGFTNRIYFASDIGNFLRLQAGSTDNFKQFLTLVNGYEQFVSYLNETIKKCNSEFKTQVNEFKNNMHEECLEIIARQLKKEEGENTY